VLPFSFADVLRETRFSASRGSGPGGQHVNKVSTKITLTWNIPGSAVLSEEQKQNVLQRQAGRVTKEGDLIISCQESRSQLANKELAMARFEELLLETFRRRKARKRTRPTKTSVKRRLESKKKHSEKKRERRGEV
jgi:ribosome-associated protein